jgi:hypothetical protein
MNPSFKKNSTLFIPPPDPYFSPQFNNKEYNEDPFEDEDGYGTFREIANVLDNPYKIKSVSCIEFDSYEEILWCGFNTVNNFQNRVT